MKTCKNTQSTTNRPDATNKAARVVSGATGLYIDPRKAHFV